VGWLIALGLLVAFSAALLSPYGRKLLAVMVAVVGTLIALVVGYAWWWSSQQKPQPTDAPATFDVPESNVVVPATNTNGIGLAPPTAPAPPQNDSLSASDRALLEADLAMGGAQRIGDKVFFCSKGYPPPNGVIPKPDQLVPCNTASQNGASTGQSPKVPNDANNGITADPAEAATSRYDAARAPDPRPTFTVGAPAYVQSLISDWNSAYLDCNDRQIALRCGRVYDIGKELNGAGWCWQGGRSYSDRLGVWLQCPTVAAAQ
jgi:hypothetical protein